MKKLFALAALMALVLPGAALAAEFKVGGSYYLNQGETLNNDLYFAGEGAFINGTAAEDVVLGVGKANISGVVTGDLLIGSGSVDITGTVEDDVRVGAGQVRISGNIKGDLIVVAGQVDILPNALIEGDILAGAGQIDVQGKVLGSIRGGAGDMKLNNEVGGDVRLNVGKLSLGDRAVINGQLKYASENQAQISTGAVIRGGTDFTKRDYNRGEKRTFSGFGFLMGLIMLFVAGLFFAIIFRRPTHAVLHDGMTKPWPSLGIGFAVLFLTPILAVMLMVTVIGMPIGVLILLAYVFALILSYLFGALLLGAWLEKWIWKRELQTTWKTVLIGSVSYIVLGLIPVIGWIFKFMIFLMALGAIFHSLRNEWWIKKSETSLQ